MIQYAKTDEAVADALGISVSAFRSWKASTDFTIRRTTKGWPLAALYDYQAERKKRDKRNVSGEHADLKRRKLEVEIDILEAKRDELRRDLIPLREHVETMQWLSAIVTGALDEFCQYTTATYHDAKMTGEAERIRDKVRKRLHDEVKHAAK